jgi:crossover junction endodeoxyribonuclease RuvC
MSPGGSLTIIGIDPGLKRTGYGVIAVEGSSHRCLAAGVISPPPAVSHTERLMRIHEGLFDIMHEMQPQEAAIEDFIIGHTRAAVAIGEARAAATLAAGRMGLPVSLYKPSEVKQFVTSYGRGSKEQVSAMVQALLGLREPPSSTDAADALAVALCHALRRGQALAIAGARR